MRTEQLQYLVDILKTGSINKTAQHFFISQQAVSNSLKQLENELGCTLLNRTATGVSLNNRGLLAVEFARTVMENYSLLLDQLAQTDSETLDKDDAPIDIQSASIILMMSLPAILDDFSRTHLQNRIRIKENIPEEVFTAVSQKQCDLALVTIRQDRFDQYLLSCQKSGLSYLPIFNDTLIVCVASTSPYANMDCIDPDLFSNAMRTLFGFTPTYEYASQAISPYENSVIVSNDVDFHKKLLLQDNRLMALMPLTAYQLFFNSRRFTARPFSGSIHFMHAILIAPQPRPIVLALAQRIQKCCRSR